MTIHDCSCRMMLADVRWWLMMVGPSPILQIKLRKFSAPVGPQLAAWRKHGVSALAVRKTTSALGASADGAQPGSSEPRGARRWVKAVRLTMVSFMVNSMVTDNMSHFTMVNSSCIILIMVKPSNYGFIGGKFPLAMANYRDNRG